MWCVMERVCGAVLTIPFNTQLEPPARIIIFSVSIFSYKPDMHTYSCGSVVDKQLVSAHTCVCMLVYVVNIIKA